MRAKADQDVFRTPNGHRGKSDTPVLLVLLRPPRRKSLDVVPGVSGLKHCRRLFVSGLR